MWNFFYAQIKIKNQRDNEVGSACVKTQEIHNSLSLFFSRKKNHKKKGVK